MSEKIAKKLRKEMGKIYSRIKFESREFFISMLKQPIKERVKIAWQILKGY